ncbi:pentapeptide repeat-containing protein [Rothia mucilaginosa]|uniref:pentapeptide repeat-containing protein n=1 Tax=Rothia mucilaginosa TaxID=43675 RepID=UPI00352CA538
MSEQDDSLKTSTNSPKLPLTPEKRFSLSKSIENIMLFISGVAFIISLFSKDKNTENKAPHKDTQKEIEEPHEKTEQTQEIKKKEIKSTPSDSRLINRMRRLFSIIHGKTLLKLNQKINKNKHKDILKKIGKAIGASFLVFIISWPFTSYWGDILNILHPIFKYLFSDNIPLGISISLATITAISILFAKYFVTRSQKGISNLTNRYFMFTLAALAILGASSALLVPSYTNLFREPGHTSSQQDSTRDNSEKVQETPTSTPSSTGNKAAEVEQKSTSDLRLHLLYITGGIIAILGLIETNRKNSQDHIRQVHAARRDRYIEAVDKLSSKQAPVRLGGVYALFGLIDEWLDDDNIDEETRLKEGQVIVNNLCSYVRSPFILAEKREPIEAVTSPYVYSGNLKKDKAKLREEQDIRRAIFIEMSKRCSTVKRKKGSVAAVSNTWSNFNFDFSRAPIFYALNNLNIEKPNFSDSTFYGKADFSGSNFIQDAKFIGAKFTQNVDFFRANFMENADFRLANFPGFAEFKNVKFRKAVNFSGIVFAQSATFQQAQFHGVANFIWTLFKNDSDNMREADFTNTKFFQGASFYRATFESIANFENAKFLKNTKFSRVDFSKATLEGGPSFLITHHRGDTIEKHLAEFEFFSTATTDNDLIKRIADFGHAIFEKKANFKNTIFGSESDADQIIDFSNTEFEQGADFTSATFNYKTYFDSSIFKKENDSTECASFSSATFRRNADFSSVVFKADVNFRAQIFGQEVDFHLANFSGTTDFSDVIFKGYTGFRYVIFETNPPKFVFTTNSGVSYPAKFVAIPETGEPHDFDVDATQSNNNTFDMGTTKYKGIDYHVPKGTVVFEYPEDWDEARQEPTKYSSPAK